MGREGYHQYRDWQPSERQRRVLDLLVEGKSNAEIAVKLGLSIDGAKWHVGELLSQTGLRDRQALAQWWQRRRLRRSRTRFSPLVTILRPALALAVVVVVAGGLLAALDGSPSGGLASNEPDRVASGPTPWPEEDIAALAALQPAPASCEPPEPLDLRLVSAEELAGRGLEAVGKVIVTGHCPVYISNRADRAVVWLGSGGYLRLDAPPEPHWQGDPPLWADPQVSRCCVRVPFSLRGDPYTLNIYGSGPVLEDTLDAFDSAPPVNAARVKQTAQAGAYLTLTVSAGESCCGGTASTAVAVSSDGEVFVHPGLLPADLLVNVRTGESIETDGLITAGRLADERRDARIPLARTVCPPPELFCTVYTDAASHRFVAPVAGRVSCINEPRKVEYRGQTHIAIHTYYELDAGDFHLRVSAWGNLERSSTAPWSCDAFDVQPGDTIEDVAGMGVIEAFAPDGSPLPIVSTRDGRLFVGDPGLQYGCPCEPTY